MESGIIKLILSLEKWRPRVSRWAGEGTSPWDSQYRVNLQFLVQQLKSNSSPPHRTVSSASLSTGPATGGRLHLAPPHPRPSPEALAQRWVHAEPGVQGSGRWAVAQGRLSIPSSCPRAPLASLPTPPSPQPGPGVQRPGADVGQQLRLSWLRHWSNCPSFLLEKKSTFHV